MPTYSQIFEEQFGVSLESRMSGTVEREIEYTIYAHIPDLEAMKEKALEVHRHEQWSLPIVKGAVDGKVRIRMIDGTRPTMCTKIKREGMEGCEEVEVDITPDLFNALKELSVDGYIKNRYTLPSTIKGLYWEFDVFLTRGGSQHNWVKVDLEIKDPNDPIPPFPVDHGRFIVDLGDLSYTDKLQVKKLWDEEWLKLEK